MTLGVNVTAARGGFQVKAAFEAEAGRTVALLGPNGSGKSTLVSTIAGLLPPVEGTIALEGALLDDPANGVHVPPERRPIGVVFQSLLLFPHLSATENVAFPLRARGVPNRRRANARPSSSRVSVSRSAPMLARAISRAARHSGSRSPEP